MDRLIIRDLLVQGIIGTNDWERTQSQDILINLAVYGDFRKAGLSDDLSDCLNYHALAEKVSAFAETARRFTVEALAEDIARLCLSEPGVEEVTVRVEKPHALWRAKSAGVEIQRTQQDLENPL